MSLFQCENCGAVENTALASQGCTGYFETFFDWKGLEDRKGKLLCSECAPPKYSDGTHSGLGVWHGVFSKMILPLGMFKTNDVGNLEHKENGDTTYSKYEVK